MRGGGEDMLLEGIGGGSTDILFPARAGGGVGVVNIKSERKGDF